MLKIPENIQFVLKTLSQNGYEAYVVGGGVRDLLLSIEPSDFDVATSAQPDEIIKLFNKTVPTGIKHGTVTVIVDKSPIEVTTFRTDGVYTDNRHPENVRFVSNLKEDLSRRDFTVNALAYNENEGLIDLFGGVGDLEKRILRAVGDPNKRFDEDALRILRLFRFSSQLDFKIDENTLEAALKLRRGLENISRERIFSEIQKAVNGKNPNALAPLINSGGFEFLGITSVPDFKTENPDIRLFCFLKESENPLETLKKLKGSNKQMDFTEKMLRLLSLNPKTKEEIKNAVFLTDLDVVGAYSEYTDADKKALDEIVKNNEPYALSHLAVSGNDLLALGFKGREIGSVLETLRQIVVKDPKKNKKEVLLSLTK